MTRLLTLGGAVAASLLAGCQAPSRPTPLPVWDTFAVDYQGRYQPAERLPDAASLQVFAPEVEGVEAEAGSEVEGGSVSMHAMLVELPIDEVRALLPIWPHTGPRLQGAHIERNDLVDRLVDWKRRKLVAAEPTLVADLGAEVTFRSLNRRAFIAHLDLKCGADPLMVDPAIGLYEYGLELCMTPRRDGDTTTLVFDWRNRARVAPSAVGSVNEGLLGSIELPMTLDQRVRGEAKVLPGAVLMLGAMVGSQPDTISLLCVEVDDRNALEVGAHVASVDPRDVDPR